MSAERNLLHKLDALLNRHRTPRGSIGEDTASIPVLTDIIEESESASVPVLSDAAPAPPSPTAVQEPVPGKADLSDAEVEALAKDIFRRVMAKLGAQLSGELRDNLTQRLSSIIDNTVAAAIADFKQELANTVGDAIAEALLDRAEKIASPRTSEQPENTGDSL